MYTSVMLVCLVVLCTLAADWLHARRARRLLSNLPSYTRLPFLGSTLNFIGGSKRVYKLLVEMGEVVEQTRLPLLFWVGPVPLVVLSEPEDVKLATNALADKPYHYQFTRVWLGDGLLTAPGYIWKRSIKKLAGTFTGKIVNGFQDVFNTQAHNLVEQLKQEAGKGPFDVMEKYCAPATLETICQTALGEPRISESIVITEYYSAFKSAVELVMKRMVNILYHPDFVYHWTSSHKDMVKCATVMHNVSNTILEKRKKQSEETKIYKKSGNENKNENNVTFKAFLDVLLDMQESDPTFTRSQIRSEINGIVIAGQETVASVLFYILLMIGCNPTVQNKLYDEIKTVFGVNKGKLEKEDLVRLEYCEAVILETLRLFPPIPVVLRRAHCNLELVSCTIPAGAAVAVNVLGAGRSWRQWGKDALEFRPERWLDRPGLSAALLAFSSGKRVCIGKRYAMAILKTILAHCVRELEFISHAENMEMKVDILLKPVSIQMIEVHLRK